ncbi:MAG: hypothetical protein ABEJ28_04980 [Salinigranum sp.]
MRTHAVVVVLALTLLAGSSVLAASAFSTATVKRSANLNVVTDGSGLIELTPGATKAVQYDASGELSIDISKTGGSGVNPNAEYTFGDGSQITAASKPSDLASTDYAFALKLNDDLNGSASGLKLDYAAATNSEPNVKFVVYEVGGSKVTTASEESSGTISNPGTKTYGVVLVVDTGAGSASTPLGKGTDLSGTLTITTA